MKIKTRVIKYHHDVLIKGNYTSMLELYEANPDFIDWVKGQKQGDSIKLSFYIKKEHYDTLTIIRHILADISIKLIESK